MVPGGSLHPPPPLHPPMSSKQTTLNKSSWCCFPGLMPLGASFRELRTPRLWRDVLCEFLVVFLLFFFHMGIGFNFHTPEDSSQSIIVIGLGSGIYVFVLIEAFGHIQYAVMNPAVVPYFVYTGKLGIVKGKTLLTPS